MAERKPCLQSEAMGRTAADTKRAVEEMVAASSERVKMTGRGLFDTGTIDKVCLIFT